jgi:ABC-type uncharacterized transport system ATPase subunit
LSPSRDAPAVALRGIQKTFGATRALVSGDLIALPGEVHALLGENGAGKTTLANILAGVHRPDAGVLELRGEERRFPSPRAALAAGVGLVHQHFTLVPALSVLENVALGLRHDRSGLSFPLRELREKLAELCGSTGLDANPDALVSDLSVGARQRVEILRVLFRNPDVLVLDEPTAVLAPPEISGLFEILRRLAGEGRTVLIIAHKLDEVLAVADRFTVLRGGRTVLSAPRRDVDASRLSKAMVGEDVEIPVASPPSPGDVVAELKDVAARNPRGGEALRSVSLMVRRGEIVGIAGVEGNGQRELARVLAGMDRPTRGSARIPRSPGWIPQDRTHEGLIPTLSLTQNVALALHGDPGMAGRWGRLDWDGIRGRTASLINRFSIRAESPAQPGGTLSGGNQQKLVVGRELTRSPDLLVAENPTRGLDVAATAFVHAELLGLRGGGEPGAAPGVVLISTDLDEILALSDRVFVLLRGVLHPVPREERSRTKVGALMVGAGETP